MKLVGGEWRYDEIVTILLDNGKTVKRKVKYATKVENGTLVGLYIVIDGEKIGVNALEK